MGRLVAFLGLLLALGGPAHALSPLTRAILAPNPCSGVMVKTDFAANGGGGVYCLNGQRYASFTAIPGASYSGSVSGTGATVRTAVNSAGEVVRFADGAPRITDLGLLVEEARTNSFLNSATGVTQSVTTTAASWTLSFDGTGSITLSGGATGALNGTGAGNRVSLTVTATAATTTLTVSGSVTNVQFEAGAFATSYIPTVGTAVTRSADVAAISGVSLPVAPWTLFGQVFYPTLAAGSMGVVAVDDGPAGNNQAILWVTGGPHPRVSLAVVGVGTYDSGSSLATIAAPLTLKMAATYAGGQITAQAQGVALAASSAVAPTTQTTSMRFGVLNGGAKPTNGYIQKAVLYSAASFRLTE